LFVSGRRAPALRDPEPPIAHLPAPVFLAEVRRRFDGLPDAALSDDESTPLLVRALRADFAMAEGYRYEQAAPFDCPIVACGGAADPHASRSDLDAWRTETRSRLSVHTFAGGHLYLERERAAVTARVANHLSVMLGALARCTGVR
jgi:surfactin synthase thioesterase subunit